MPAVTRKAALVALCLAGCATAPLAPKRSGGRRTTVGKPRLAAPALRVLFKDGFAYAEENGRQWRIAEVGRDEMLGPGGDVGDPPQRLFLKLLVALARHGALDDGDERPIRVSGYVSQPDTHRGNRDYITLFCNGRWIQDRGLTFAVEQAYHTLLPGDRHPLGLDAGVAGEDAGQQGVGRHLPKVLRVFFGFRGTVLAVTVDDDARRVVAKALWHGPGLDGDDPAG